MSSPPKARVSDSEEVSDSDDPNDSDSDEDQPSISVISYAHQHQSQPITAEDFHKSDLHVESPPLPEINNDDFADVEATLSMGREMAERAMGKLERVTKAMGKISGGVFIQV